MLARIRRRNGQAKVAAGVVLLLACAALAVGCGGDDDASEEAASMEPSTRDEGSCIVEFPPRGRVEVQVGNSGLPCEEAKSIYDGYTSWLTAEYEAGNRPEDPAAHTVGDWECYSLPFLEPGKPLAACENEDRKFVMVAMRPQSQKH